MNTTIIKTVVLNTLISIGLYQSTFAQSMIDQAIEKKVAERSIPAAQIGSLICENAMGDLALCSGNMEETVIGIATNVPYVTINKPATPNGNKSIFLANVSADNGPIFKGDLLIANQGGTLAKANSDLIAFAYAIALEDANSLGKIQVKLLGK
jgi:hypothetical protein